MSDLIDIEIRRAEARIRELTPFGIVMRPVRESEVRGTLHNEGQSLAFILTMEQPDWICEEIIVIGVLRVLGMDNRLEFGHEYRRRQAEKEASELLEITPTNNNKRSKSL